MRRPSEHSTSSWAMQPDLVAVVAAFVPRLPAETAAVPAVAEHRPDRVDAGPQQCRHVVGVGEQPVAVRRPAGRQEIGRHRSSVDRDALQPERGDVQARPGHGRWDVELAADQRGRRLLAAAGVVGERDRLADPVRGADEPGLDQERLAPVRPARGVADPDPIVADLAAGQRPTRRPHGDLLVAVDVAGRREDLVEAGGGRGVDPVPELDCARRVRDETPRQPDRPVAR